MDFSSESNTNTPTIMKQKPTALPPLRSPAFLYMSMYGTGGRSRFLPSEYDLREIGRIEDTESLLMQAFQKKLGLMFKEGWDFLGPNIKTVAYIKRRFSQMAQVSGTSVHSLLRDMGSALIKKSNCFLVKVRKVASSGGRVRKLPGTDRTIEPIAAYFQIPAETMQYQLASNGKRVIKWEHAIDESKKVVFSPEDVVHMTFNRKEGFIFGTPSSVPVVDDIRALRKIEENIELLVYQHLFPLFHYKVGTDEFPAGYTEDGQAEISIAKQEVRNMPAEGGIITDHRHEIKLLGMEGRALRADGYLEYFKKRVLAGLGISAVDIGEGNTANRACYSEDTETLTDSGFKFYWEVTSRDKIATFNPQTDEVEFHYPTQGLYVYDYAGPMFHFKNRDIDVMVTPDHDMWAQCATPGGSIWKKVHADQITQQYVKFRTSNLGWNGKTAKDFCLPGVISSYTTSNKSSGITIEDWLEFLGYYVFNGSLTHANNMWAVTLTLNSQMATRAFDCLQRLPFKFDQYFNSKNDTTLFVIDCKDLYAYLSANCGVSTCSKHFPGDVLSLSPHLLQIILDAVLKSNGYSGRMSIGGSKLYVCHVANSVLLDQLQEIALKLGYYSRVTNNEPRNILHICSQDASSYISQDSISVQDYSGKVYCFNVPNHLFITRRNGRIGIHGNTADNMSRNLVDSVKDIQSTLESMFNEMIIKELLLEADFQDIDPLDEKNHVFLKFREIDVDAKIKKDNHLADLFQKNAISHDEMRTGMGFEPLEIPTREETRSGKDTEEKYRVWHRINWKLFDEPKMLIQAIDEPWSLEARAAAQNASIELGQAELNEAQAEQAKAVQREKLNTSTKVTKDADLYHTDLDKDAPVPTISVTRKRFDQAEDMLVAAILVGQSDSEWLGSKIRSVMEPGKEELLVQAIGSFYSGYMSTNHNVRRYAAALETKRVILRDRIEAYTQRLVEDLVRQVRRQVQQARLSGSSTFDMTVAIRTVFDTFRYRSNFIDITELRNAHILGKVIAHSDLGRTKVRIVTQAGACKMCRGFDGREVLTDAYGMSDLPPFHPNCICDIEYI